MLTADELELGALYRAKHPHTISGIFRDTLDDRVIVWISNDRTVLQYNGPGVPQGQNQTITFEKFLQWASHRVTMPKEDE